jgi:hypothetical protein
MGSAQADCSPPTAATTYPHAAAAIAAWESARGVRVASDTKERILTQFCKSSENLAVSDALKPAEVDAKAQEAIKDYLDRQVDPSVPGRTMGATLRGLFGHHGFSQPVIKPDGLIEITYAHAGVDRLSIGAYTVDPAPKFLVPTGKVTVIGYTKNAEVCRISTMVSTTQPATVTC